MRKGALRGCPDGATSRDKLEYLLRVRQRKGRRFAPTCYVGPKGPTHNASGAARRVGWRLGRGVPVLSMGMGHDFEVAAEEGATEVRVGTAIFGGRVPR